MWTNRSDRTLKQGAMDGVFSTVSTRIHLCNYATYLLIHIITNTYPQQSQQLRVNPSYCVRGSIVITSPPAALRIRRCVTFLSRLGIDHASCRLLCSSWVARTRTPHIVATRDDFGDCGFGC